MAQIVALARVFASTFVNSVVAPPMLMSPRDVRDLVCVLSLQKQKRCFGCNGLRSSFFRARVVSKPQKLFCFLVDYNLSKTV
jgi:hypothetical protein